MLPELNPGQNVYVEITNPSHGGAGWELGTRLWSPVYSKARAKSWQIMERLKPGDLVLHLVTTVNRYHWAGISQVSARLAVVEDEPPRPSRWAGMSPYQRVSLENYTPMEEAQPVSDFFESFEQELREHYSKSLFYDLYGEGAQLRISQRYLAACPPWLYALFGEFSNRIGYSPEFGDAHSHMPTQNEPPHPDYSAPGRASTVVSRIIRDTELARTAKREYAWRCQVCGVRIKLPNGHFYAEAHHLVPLGGNHRGPDTMGNIVVLCPNHHAQFDYGAMAIDPGSMKTVHVDNSHPEHMKELAYQRHDLLPDFLTYHYKEIFGGGKSSQG